MEPQIRAESAVGEHPRRDIVRTLTLTLSHLLDRFQVSGEVVALGTGLLVGLGTGLSAVLFNLLIQAVTRVSFDWLPRVAGVAGRWFIVVVPVVGGLIAGPLIHFFAREAKGRGVPEMMQAIALEGGRIRPL